MKITVDKLRELDACESGIDKFIKSGLEGKHIKKVIKEAIKQEEFEDANWLLAECMDYKQYVLYAVYSAEKCIEEYEKHYPDDDRPRKAIEAAKLCAFDPTQENKEAARSARSAARSAGAAAWSAWSAARSAGAAAESAAWSAAESAARSAGAAAWSARSARYKDLLEYGVSLFEDNNLKYYPSMLTNITGAH
jgi:hypothetical protein